eukprot:g7695.t1
MVGLSRRQGCWGCVGLVAISTLAAYLLAGAPSEPSPIGARRTPTAAAVADDVDEQPDPATVAADAAAADAVAADAVDAVGATLMSELYRLAREDVLRILDEEAEPCVNWRKAPTHNCTEPSQCGKGWLFRRKDLLLAVVVANTDDAATTGGDANNMAEAVGTGDPRREWQAGKPRMVNVVGLREGGGGELADCDSKDLSMLLRLQGPEALAEAAIPVMGKCAWTVRFRPALEGVYDLDVTLLNWRGKLEAHESQCNEVVGQYGEGSVEMDSVSGVPFYGNFEGCCTLCTRTERCVAWSATNAPEKAQVDGKRCVLYSSVVGKPVEDKRLRQAIRSGTPRKEEHMMYLGPSMSIARRWCSQENGNVYVGIFGQITVTEVRGESQEEQRKGTGGLQKGAASTAAASLRADEATLPLCSTDSTSLPRDGRWVSLRATECQFKASMMDPTWWPVYDKEIFGATMPEECYLRPIRAGSAELKAAIEGYVWQPYDCRYDLMSSEARMSCFRDKNVTRFLDFGDSLISTSRSPRSALWLPTADRSAWSTGKGIPQIGKGAEEAGCVGGPIQYYAEASYQQQPAATGAAAATPAVTGRYCGVEAYWQLKPGQLRNLISSFKPDVVLANWAIVHRLWHHTFEEFGVFLRQLANQLDDMAQKDPHRPRYMFWLSTPFLVSEREPHCVMERGLQYTKALRDTLEPRGWIEIDWVSMTRKWGFDIADGMHHGPPPTRMLAYLLVHHVCHAAESDQQQIAPP